MSVTLRLVHRAGYTYSGPAVASYNEARMIPRSSASQTVSHTRMEITPTPWQDSWTDYWGTRVTTFELHEPHEELKVVAISTVTVHRVPVQGGGLTWQDLSVQKVVDDLGEYLDPAERCAAGAELTEFAEALRRASSTPAEFVERLIPALHERVVFSPTRSAHYATAQVAWDSAGGGAIDLAHVTIAALRAVGIPARFVTGYVLPDRHAPVGDVISGFGHPWVEWWDAEWVACDPAMRTTPDDFYIEVAHGRDYSDVAPLRGIFTGTPGSKMSVTVEISRLA